LNRGVSGKADVGVQNLSINWDIQSRITKNKYREQKRVKKVVERVRGMSSKKSSCIVKGNKKRVRKRFKVFRK